MDYFGGGCLAQSFYDVLGNFKICVRWFFGISADNRLDLGSIFLVSKKKKEVKI